MVATRAERGVTGMAGLVHRTGGRALPGCAGRGSWFRGTRRCPAFARCFCVKRDSHACPCRANRRPYAACGPFGNGRAPAPGVIPDYLRARYGSGPPADPSADERRPAVAVCPFLSGVRSRETLPVLPATSLGPCIPVPHICTAEDGKHHVSMPVTVAYGQRQRRCVQKREGLSAGTAGQMVRPARADSRLSLQRMTGPANRLRVITAAHGPVVRDRSVSPHGLRPSCLMAARQTIRWRPRLFPPAARRVCDISPVSYPRSSAAWLAEALAGHCHGSSCSVPVF